jgi:hypothetical protein
MSRIGIFLDEPAADYHRTVLGEANNSGLKVIDERTPAHYFQWVQDRNKPKTPDEEFKEQQHFRVGRIVHSAILEPDKFNEHYVEMPYFGKMQSSTNRAIRDEWLKSLPPGTSVVEEGEKKLAMAMRDAVLRHKTARLIIEGGRPEVTLRWIDKRTGLLCKARADWWHEELQFAMDLKSTEDASPIEFGRSVARYGYHRQHCHYSSGFSANDRPLRNYLLLPVEKPKPHAVGVYHIDAAAEERGFQILHRSMDKLAECMRTGRWPAYSDNIEVLTLPGWAYSDRG